MNATERQMFKALKECVEELENHAEPNDFRCFKSMEIRWLIQQQKLLAKLEKRFAGERRK